MLKWHKSVALMVLLAWLCGGGTVDAASGHANASKSLEFPVSNLSEKLAQHAVPLSLKSRIWRVLKKVPIDAQVQEVTANVALIDVFPPANGPWPAGLDLLNLETGKVKDVVHVPTGQEAFPAAILGNWVVYENGRAGSGGYRTIVAKNMASGKSRPIFELPRLIYSAGSVQGLTIHGGRAYWLSNLVTPRGLVSRVYSDDLQTGHLKVLAQVNDSRQHRLMLAMAAAPNGLWVSVSATGAAAAHHPGALWYLPWSGSGIGKQVIVWHAPTLLYGATNSAVIFSADYSPVPSSSVNPPPFPVYAADVAVRRVFQLTPRFSPGRVGSVAGSWVSIDAIGDQSIIVNLKTMRDMTLPLPQAVVGTNWVVLRGPNMITWTRLNLVKTLH
jgi:hypothetical protein